MNFQAELETLIRARYPILYVITSEEVRVQKLLVEIAMRRQKTKYKANTRRQPTAEMMPGPAHDITIRAAASTTSGLIQVSGRWIL